MIKFLFSKIKKIYYLKKYSIAFYIKKQNKIYIKHGLSRLLGIKKLLTILNNLSITPKRLKEHQIILSAISVTNPKFKNILEIGTFDGQNALILSKLFRQAKIHTIDLKVDDYYPSHFFNSYVKSNKLLTDIRNNNIKQCKNIKFEYLNSIKLLK